MRISRLLKQVEYGLRVGGFTSHKNISCRTRRESLVALQEKEIGEDMSSKWIVLLRYSYIHRNLLAYSTWLLISQAF